jgi:hypothetical protein
VKSGTLPVCFPLLSSLNLVPLLSSLNFCTSSSTLSQSSGLAAKRAMFSWQLYWQSLPCLQLKVPRDMTSTTMRQCVIASASPCPHPSPNAGAS